MSRRAELRRAARDAARPDMPTSPFRHSVCKVCSKQRIVSAASGMCERCVERFISTINEITPTGPVEEVNDGTN